MVAEARRTACSRDCPDACGILARVENGRVIAIEGDPGHPVTKGFLCFRTSRFLEVQNGGARLKGPLARKGDDLVPVSWDEALAVAADHLRRIRAESGPAAIFHYRSGGSLGILKHLTDLFFDLLGPCTGKVGDICSGAGEAAQVEDFGVSDSNDLFDLKNSRQVILWGKNPVVSSVHLIPLLKELRAAGGRVVLIDPVQHQCAHHADHVLQPAPGSDFELVMAIVRLLFESGRVDLRAGEFCENLPAFKAMAMQQTVVQWIERTGLSVTDVGLLADCMANGPTAILVGWGMQRRQRGGAIVRALDALCAVSGNLFRAGGGCSFYFKRRRAFAPFGPKADHPRVIREPLLGQDLLAAKAPPVRCMWVTAGNPVSMLPDSATVARALEQIEFLVVADCLLTDTAARADLVLPVPTMLEDDDLLGSYGHHWLAESRPAVAPPAGVRHEVHIFQDLARRLGLSEYPQSSIDDLKHHALREVAGRGAGLEALREKGHLRNPLASPLLFPDGRVQTPSGRVRLLAEPPPPVQVSAPPAQPGSSRPLWLFSNSTARSQASVWAGKGLGDCTWVVVHPDAVAGMRAGQEVVVESAQASLRAELRFDSAQRPDVAIMPKGGHHNRGHSANTLIAARATDLGLGAAYLDCLVRIRPR